MYTDSLSDVRALCSNQRSQDYTVNLISKAILSACTENFDIPTCWVPDNCGIVGSQVADEMTASAALHGTVDITTVPYTDTKPHIRKLRKTLQADWSEQTDMLHVIKPHLRSYTTDTSNRYTELALAGLRIGHSGAIHTYMLTGSSRPLCSRCRDALSVVLILSM